MSRMLSTFFYALFFLLIPTVIFAQTDIAESGQLVAETAGLATTDIRVLVAQIVNVFLGLLGLITVILIIYAGFLWMTARGDEPQVKKAQEILKGAIVGLIIIALSYAIAQFIFRALLGSQAPAFIGGSGAQNGRTAGLIGSGRGQSALGNGVIEYHYPESGQNDVPRNTKISITFKQPIVLSSVFLRYDDNGTPEVTDDRLCANNPPCPDGTPVNPFANDAPPIELNRANVRVVSSSSLGSGNTQTFDERVPERSSSEAFARVTALRDPISALDGQTLLLTPRSPLGSPSTAVNLRVALRGGRDGVLVWGENPGTGTLFKEAAFSEDFSDGGYFWTFTTNTTIDVTPPKIVAIVPSVTRTPGIPSSSILARNQLIQVYFDEPVDPISASGSTNDGFTNIAVNAECLDGTFRAEGEDDLSSCDFANGERATVPGLITVGNKYRTIEFASDALCEGVKENSCGEPVTCLPKNVSLSLVVFAATVGSEPPRAIIANGVQDMAGNSFDGNKNGSAEGPQSPVQPDGRSFEYSLNAPPESLADVSDTARADFIVGSTIDLTPPVITAIDPPSPPPEDAKHPIGPSNVPPTLPISITFSKTMSINSLRSGGFDEKKGELKSKNATVILRSFECAKVNANPCPVPRASCECVPLDPPAFFIDSGTPFESPEGSGKLVSRIALTHPRPFFRAEDLGYIESDIRHYPELLPTYVPIIRAGVRDTRQNCFSPSVFAPEGDRACVLGTGENSCCDRSGVKDGNFFGTCAPSATR